MKQEKSTMPSQWFVRCGDSFISKKGGWTGYENMALLLDLDAAVKLAEDLSTVYNQVYVAEPKE